MTETFRDLAQGDGTPLYEAVLEQFACHAAVNQNDPAGLQRVLDTCGGGEIVAFQYLTGTVLPALAVYRQGNHWYVQVCGTMTKEQWAGNVLGAVAPTPVTVSQWAQSFWWGTAKVLLRLAQPILPPPSPDLRITFVGFSLGGAVAYALALQLRATYNFQQMELLQLDAPKLLTVGALDVSPPVHFRVRIPYDPVPMVPPSQDTLTLLPFWVQVNFFWSLPVGWQQYGQGWVINDAGEWYQDTPQPDASALSGAWLFQMQPGVHSVKNLGICLHAGVTADPPVSARGLLVDAEMVAEISKPPSEKESIPFVPGAGLDAASANQLYFGSTSGPISDQTIATAVTATVQTTQNGPVSGSNIQGFFGGSSMAISGIWKFTAIISAGPRNKSTSIIWNGGTTDINSALPAAQRWANFLADCFGNHGITNPVNGGTPASPGVAYLRITDAINPRYGQLFQCDMTQTAYIGRAGKSPANNDADFAGTALSLRLSAAYTSGQTTYSAFANHTILFPPDAFVVGGNQMDFTYQTAVGLYSVDLLAYINYISLPANKLGCLVNANTIGGAVLTNFRFLNGAWTCTPTVPVTWPSQGRIRLIRASAPGWAGTYRVIVLANGDVQLTSTIPQSVQAPVQAYGYLVQDAQGVKQGKFGQFSTLPGGANPPYNLFVTKRNPAKPFNPVSFRHRRRRPTPVVLSTSAG